MSAEDTRRSAGGRQEQYATRQSEEPVQRTSRTKGETETSNENRKKGHGQLCISLQNTGTAAIQESVGGATSITDMSSNVNSRGLQYQGLCVQASGQLRKVQP